MRCLIVIAILFASAVVPDASAEQLVILSLGKDQEIAIYSLNDDDGTLTLQSTTETTGKPGAMCVDRDSRHLYVAMKATGSIAAFRIEDDSTLSLIGESIVNAGASYLSIHPDGKYLVSSYYAAGKVAVHQINREGGLFATASQEIETDEKAHAAVFDPSGKFLFVPHTRPNAIFQFAFDSTTGKLSAGDPAKLQREPDSGPRHLWFHPIKGFAYGSDEQGNSVTAYRLDSQAGSLEVMQTVSSLPATRFTGRNTTSDIEVHPSGKFVFVANRGYDAIATYSVDGESGQLKLLQHTETEPVTRSFNVSPDGRYLVAAGQTSGKLAVLSIDKQGWLKRESTIDAGQNPWWVQVIERPASQPKEGDTR